MPTLADVYYKYGCFCGEYPWHILMTIFTALSLIVSRAFTSDASENPTCHSSDPLCNPALNGLDLVILTCTRVFAILSIYSQVEIVRKIGFRYILYLSLVFTVFSALLFSSAVVFLMGSVRDHLVEVLPFFLLLVDVPKTVLLGKAVITAQSTSKLSYRKALGNSMLKFGPIYTLNFVVGSLLLSMGLILGVKSLFIVSYLGVLVSLTNFFVFMTIYPAILFLFGEVYISAAKPVSKIREFVIDTECINCDFMLAKSSAAMVKIKIIMSIGVMIVHIMNKLNRVEPLLTGIDESGLLPEHMDLETVEFLGGFTVATEHVILVILTAALTVRFYISEFYNPACIEIDNSISQRSSESQVNGNTERMESMYSSQKSSSPVTEDNPLYSRNISWASETMNTVRPFSECVDILQNDGIQHLVDLEVVQLVKSKVIPAYSLEQKMDPTRAVSIRRELISQLSENQSIFELPHNHFDYNHIKGACCENVIGYTQIPVGVVGPISVNGVPYYVPMATTEGALVASTNRGCKALSCGVNVHVTDLGITRAPAVKFPDTKQAVVFCNWLKCDSNLKTLQDIVSERSRFTKLTCVVPNMAGRIVFVRFQATTGDAMGMNMISQAVEQCLLYLNRQFPGMSIVTVSGNYCTDKKPSALNWISGRGKKVVAEAQISGDVIEKQMKCKVSSLVELNTTKNLIGSAMAGSVGGFNAHAANMVTAIFIATGQDPAQVVGSSNCITILEEQSGNLVMSCTIPALEVGTLGGGTILPAQKAALKMLGVAGATREPLAEGVDSNSKQLAAIIGAVVLAGELSLLSALASGDLVKSHLNLNRSPKPPNAPDS